MDVFCGGPDGIHSVGRAVGLETCRTRERESVGCRRDMQSDAGCDLVAHVAKATLECVETRQDRTGP